MRVSPATLFRIIQGCLFSELNLFIRWQTQAGGFRDNHKLTDEGLALSILSPFTSRQVPTDTLDTLSLIHGGTYL